MVDEQMTFDAKVGNPWSILPIKNKKYAKDLVEVHLSDRSLSSLTKFEEFPNLEVIWLNNNQVSCANCHQIHIVSQTCIPFFILTVTKLGPNRKQFPRQRALLSE